MTQITKKSILTCLELLVAMLAGTSKNEGEKERKRNYKSK
jgi:hypothetical protein